MEGKKTLVIVLGTIALGILVMVCLGIGIYFTQGNVTLFGIHGGVMNEQDIQKEETFDTKDLQNLKIAVAGADVEVILTDDTELRVVQYAKTKLKQKELFVSKTEGSSLTIEDGRLQPSICFFCVGNYQMLYKIYLPRTYKQNFDLSTVSGDLMLPHEINMKKASFHSTSGDLSLGHIDADDIQIQTTSGEVNAGRLQGSTVMVGTTSGDVVVERIMGKTEIQSTSGTISVDTINGETVAIDTTSGDIELTTVNAALDVHSTSGEIMVDRLQGMLKAHTVSGDIEITRYGIKGNSEVQTTSGTVYIGFDSGSNCEVKTDTTSGDVSLPNDSHLIGSGATYEIRIETISGDIDIDKS